MSLEDDLLRQRLDRVKKIEALGFRPYGHRFDITHAIPAIVGEFSSKTGEELESSRVQVRVAGRVQTAASGR